MEGEERLGKDMRKFPESARSASSRNANADEGEAHAIPIETDQRTLVCDGHFKDRQGRSREPRRAVFDLYFGDSCWRLRSLRFILSGVLRARSPIFPTRREALPKAICPCACRARNAPTKWDS